MAKAQTAAHNFVTLVLDDSVPGDYEAVKARIVTIAEEYKGHTAALDLWYQGTVDKLIAARNDLEIRVDPKAFVDRVVSEKDDVIAKLRAQLEEATKGGKNRVPSPDDRPIPDADQEKFYEQIRKMAAGFHAQKDVFSKIGWDRDHAAPVIKRLVARGFLDKQQGVKGPAPQIKVSDKSKDYIKDPEQMALPS